jgi:hypothetical protein
MITNSSSLLRFLFSVFIQQFHSAAVTATTVTTTTMSNLRRCCVFGSHRPPPCQIFAPAVFIFLVHFILSNSQLDLQFLPNFFGFAIILFFQIFYSNNLQLFYFPKFFPNLSLRHQLKK